jgi:hypothetical protein
MTMADRSIANAELAAALAAGRVEAEMEIRALAVRYVADRDSIEITTTRHAGFLIPRGWIGALHDVPIEELTTLAVWPDGSAIELEDRDIQISVDGLPPAMLPTKMVVALFASRGGRSTSTAKRNSARENGLKGGRPRKAGKAAA